VERQKRVAVAPSAEEDDYRVTAEQRLQLESEVRPPESEVPVSACMQARLHVEGRQLRAERMAFGVCSRARAPLSEAQLGQEITKSHKNA